MQLAKNIDDCGMELARRLIPSVQNDDDLGYCLWNETSYPFGTILQVARQLKMVERHINGEDNATMA